MLLALCTLSLPLGHASAFIAESAVSRSLLAAACYPLHGGTRHTVFQSLAAITWAASLACSLLAPASLQRVATALGVLSVVLYTKGHLTHDKFLQRVSHHGRRHLVFVVGLCAAILAFTGTDLLLVEASARPPAASGHAVCPVPGPHSPPQGQWHATAVALACLLVAAMSAHGVAGHVLHGGGARRSGGWHFFQPFKGGAVFVASQGLSWTLFVAVVLGALHAARAIAAGLLHLSPLLLAALAAATAAATFGLSTSALAFVDGSATKRIASYACGLRRGLRSPSDDALVAATAATCRRRPTSAKAASAPQLSAQPAVAAEAELKGVQTTRAALLGISRLACLAYVYLPGHTLALSLALPYFLAPVATAPGIAAAQATLLAVYYAATLRGDPAHTGCREWPAVIEWLQAHLGPALTSWMGRCEVHKAFEGDLDPAQRYIFGFLPHGLYPAGAGYVTHLPAWRRAFPGVAPRVLVANIMHYVPLIRDLGAWIGFRQVTRAAFARALREVRHVLMCPGGQRELLYAAEARPGGGRGRRPVVRVCVQHRGVCRMAAEHGAALLPVLCFGELLQLQNAVTWSWLQRRTYKLIGFPLPYLALGFWGSPFPKRVPAVFVVGPPVHPSPRAPGEAVTDEMVGELHRRFYESVRTLWDDYRHQHEGYGDHVLEFDGEL